MFTTPCFIRKNTPELRLELERIGYIHGKPSNYNDDDNIYDFILCFENKYYLLSQCNYTIREGHPLKKYGSIDCCTNENLLLAIAALKNDSDIFQWFVGGQEWLYCTELSFYRYMLYEWDDDCANGYHKATIEELKEHFKE